ncbi:MAG: hypothetical protein RIG77_25455 [Cyclobacteriaceae bacterium]
MAIQTITLSLESGTTNLILTDNQGHSGTDITTDVSPLDIVLWKIESGSAIQEITSIYRKSGSVNVFSSIPVSLPGGDWKGIVAGLASGTEQYGVKYKVDGTEYDVDPYIRVQ